MPGRQYTATAYRYGFNNKEKDDEVAGIGNSIDFGSRTSDSRLGGRFLSSDPQTKKYPYWAPYSFAANNPIRYIDVNGAGPGNSILSFFDGIDMLVEEQIFKLRREIAVPVFKYPFSNSYLARSLIDHYAYGGGSPYKLTSKDMLELHVSHTGIQGISPKDQAKFTALLGTITPGSTVKLSNYQITGAANQGGTLGRFTISFTGELTVDKDDPSKWSFSGKMQYRDKYDFQTDATPPGDLERTDWGNDQTSFAKDYLPGTGFDVNSDQVEVKQTSADDELDYFKGKTEESSQNKVSTDHPKEVKAVQKERKESKTPNSQ